MISCFSLGTGVASHLVSLLCQEGAPPAGLVLESPFNNIFDEVRNHPMSWVWRKMPWFDWFFTDSLAKVPDYFKNSDFDFVNVNEILLGWLIIKVQSWLSRTTSGSCPTSD